MKRPFGVTVLAILSGFLAVLAIFGALRFLGVMFRPVGMVVPGFWYALMYGLLAWVYIWLTQMLWRLDPAAWLFLAVITVFNLILDFTLMLGSETWSDVSISFIINALILIYIMLPGTRKLFGQK